MASWALSLWVSMLNKSAGLTYVHKDAMPQKVIIEEGGFWHIQAYQQKKWAEGRVWYEKQSLLRIKLESAVTIQIQILRMGYKSSIPARQKKADGLKAIWASITPTKYHKLISYLPWCIDAIIYARGGPTVYWVHMSSSNTE